MTVDELEQRCDSLEVELGVLRSLVVALVVLLDNVSPGIRDDIIGGLSGASSELLGDDFLARQGARAVSIQLAVDNLCNRLSTSR